ncbi:hypothetical protein EW146_g1172 [Bondarzewia mesenterica]|uniref:Uncharacterized protein n=1 Tax=Bondarzewia mesenterica TaxID=1095465 RepID=A0A4S4MB03_9AGAM|nr:hypothetical protein EW146_g1172 [Bondarzewia mesenterica]
MSGATIREPSSNSKAPYSIHVEVPPRLYIVPGTAMVVGTALGLVRGSRMAGLRFLAENAHRPPTTIKGWYLYNKTKNYRMMLAGLQEAGKEAGKLGFTAIGWVTFEEGLKRMGWGEVSEIGAGVGTAALFAGVYRLSLKAAYRTGILGLVIGVTMRTMRYGRDHLAAQQVEGETSGRGMFSR